MSYLLRLPNELLEAIFTCAEFDDLLSLISTNRRIREFIFATTRLRYRFYLECFGVEEQLPEGQGTAIIPTARRLEALLGRERRWLNVQPLCAALPRRYGPHHYDDHGHFQGDSSLSVSGSRIFRAWGNGAPDWATHSKTQPMDIISTTLSRPQYQWRAYSHIRARVHRWAATYVSEADDLLVVMDYVPRHPQYDLFIARIAFLQLSTGRLHPAAAKPLMRLAHYDANLAGLEWELQGNIQQAGGLLAVIVANHQSRPDDDAYWTEPPPLPFVLRVFDWKSGEHIIRPTLCSSPAIAFLRQDILLVVDSVLDQLDLLRLPAVQDRLPMPSPIISYVRRSLSPLSGRECSHDLRFAPQHRHSLLFFTSYLSVHSVRRRQAFIVHPRKLLSLFDAAATSGNGAHFFAQDEWVPTCARWLNQLPIVDFETPQMANSGYRLSGIRDPAGALGPRPLVIIDANPWTVELVKRAAQGTAEEARRHPKEARPIWSQLGILPGTRADGTLRTESGAILRLVLPTTPVTAPSTLHLFINPPTQSDLAYVEITRVRRRPGPDPTPYDCRFAHINSESVITNGPRNPNEPLENNTLALMYFG
ncbi:hypothetical protein MIND_00180600 [Mycena indigotica]|uniref:F-box domain-containing protein n=1 Tax=Mycena indigotica TaxID=2126181 RepID=A0A8H6T7E2_9AGAR|nr:uncharacterized protein MIND_00180600 [Mycena indigotica]KAF7311707.1 hypothetical protein MIND_00180600 [Mycena indigotica]